MADRAPSCREDRGDLEPKENPMTPPTRPVDAGERQEEQQ
jgi:hypothetical protein